MDSTHDNGLCCSTVPACHLLTAGQLLTQISHCDIDIRNTVQQSQMRDCKPTTADLINSAWLCQRTQSFRQRTPKHVSFTGCRTTQLQLTASSASAWTDPSCDLHDVDKQEAQSRYGKLTEAFRSRFGDGPEVFARAPGGC